MSKETKQTARQLAQEAVRRDAVNERYDYACGHSVQVVLNSLQTTPKGLSVDKVNKIRDKFGNNRVTHEKEKTLLQRLAKAFVNPFTAILFVLVIVSSITDIILPVTQGEGAEFLTVSIITAMIIISGLMRFIQESRSSVAVRKLLAMITTKATVERIETGAQEIDFEDIVVGDVVRLSAGDMVPAGVRIIQSKDLFISQSALTGESDPLEKIPDKPAIKPIRNVRTSHLWAATLSAARRQPLWSLPATIPCLVRWQSQSRVKLSRPVLKKA